MGAGVWGEASVAGPVCGAAPELHPVSVRAECSMQNAIPVCNATSTVANYSTRFNLLHAVLLPCTSPCTTLPCLVLPLPHATLPPHAHQLTLPARGREPHSVRSCSIPSMLGIKHASSGRQPSSLLQGTGDSMALLLSSCGSMVMCVSSGLDSSPNALLPSINGISKC